MVTGQQLPIIMAGLGTGIAAGMYSYVLILMVSIFCTDYNNIPIILVY